MISVIGSSRLFVFLESNFSDFWGHAVWLRDIPNSCFDLLVLHTENLGEPWRFSFLLRFFSFQTFSYRELCNTTLGAHHHRFQVASRSFFWGMCRPPYMGIGIPWSFNSGTCRSVLDTCLGTCQVCTLTYLLSFKLHVSGQLPLYLFLIFYSVLVTLWLLCLCPGVLVPQLSSTCENMVQKHSLFVAGVSDTSQWQKKQQPSFLKTGVLCFSEH